MNRQEANILIAEKLLEICKDSKTKNLRFGQILVNSNLILYDYDSLGLLKGPKDIYNTESNVLLERMKAI